MEMSASPAAAAGARLGGVAPGLRLYAGHLAAEVELQDRAVSGDGGGAEALDGDPVLALLERRIGVEVRGREAAASLADAGVGGRSAGHRRALSALVGGLGAAVGADGEGGHAQPLP